MLSAVSITWVIFNTHIVHAIYELSEEEIAIVMQSSDKMFAYIPQLIHEPLCYACKQINNPSDALIEVVDLIKHNVHIVRNEVMVHAVEDALEYFAKIKEPNLYELLAEYRESLSEQAITRTPVYKFFNNIIARGFIRARVLAVDQDAVIHGNLNVDGTINGANGSNFVMGPTTATVNAVPRFNSTSGNSVANSAVLVDDSGNITIAGITKNGNTVNWPSTVGAANTYLGSDGSGNLIYSTPAGAGNVDTALNFTVNNAVLTTDLPNGAQNIKQSSVILDSSGNITGVAGLTMTGNLNIEGQKELRLQDNSGSGDYVGFNAPASVGTSYTLSFPDAAPTAGQVLQAGSSTPTQLTWLTAATLVTPSVSRGIYVSKAGNDSTGNGGSAAPYATLSKAITVANTLASASNPLVIVVGPGIYTEDNSAGPLTITASGISIVGTSLDGTVIQPSTLSQSLLQCTVNGLGFYNFSIDAGNSGSTASGIVFASNAAGVTRFESMAAYRFLTAFECNGSDGTPILLFNNVQPRGNTTGIAFSSCRGIIIGSAFLGPYSGSTAANTGITVTGVTSLITILSNSYRLMDTCISVSGQSNIRFLGSNIGSSTNGIVVSDSARFEIVGCNFVNNNASSVNVSCSGAGTQIHLSGSHFDGQDSLSVARGIGIKAISSGAIFVDGCGVGNLATGIQCGAVGDTSATHITANGVTITDCTQDIVHNGTTSFVFNASTAASSKITINDSTNVNLAFFDTDNNNSLQIGNFSDTDTLLLQASLGIAENPQIDYRSNLYGSQAIGYMNTAGSVATFFAQSANNVQVDAITTDRTKRANVRLVSDTSATVGDGTSIRGWDITKNPTTAELAFQYQNNDITGQSVISTYTVVAMDGVNNQLQLPTAATQIVFAADTNLYRSAADTLKTDDNFIAAGTISASSGFSGNLTGNVTGAASLNVLKAGDTMTGSLTLPAGSAASPQLQFTGSTNTGLSAGTANTLSFDTNGSERMTVSSSGVAINNLSTAGVVHNNASGLLSTSLIVNGDITDSTITNAKLATIASTNTSGAIVVRDGSGNFSTNMITIIGTTTNDDDVATKSYVDSVASTGLVAKTPALVASTTDITLSTLQTIDGVLLVANDRVLLVGQTDPVENGLWLAQSGAWTRPTDFANGDTAEEAYVLVTSGDTYAGASWLCSTPTAVIGTDDIQFQQFSIPGQTTADNVGVGTGQLFKNKTGNTINLRTIIAGTHLTAATGTDEVTLSTDATNANTVSTIVARDGSGNFSAGTITASLTGHASLDLPLTGGTLTGALTIPAGSAASPALKFTGSTNTGISAATANTLSFDTEGTERVTISSSGLAIPAFSTAGVVHNDASGLLSSSLIVNDDITDATIANEKLATIDSANTAGAIVVRDGSGNFSAGTITANLAGNVTGSASLNVLKAGDTMTGALLMPAGSAATPAVQIGATNVGISSQSSGLTLSTNGTARVTVSSAGTVAITDAAGGFTTAGVVHNDSSGNLTSTLIVNADISASAAIADTKLATISTAGKVSNSATTATSSNTANAIVARDASGDFSAGTITATNFVGSISGYLPLSGGTLTGALTIPAGSAASPSLKFSGGTNTGISSATANTLSFDTSGVERMTISSTGVDVVSALTAGTGLVATTGGVTATAGNITASSGNMSASGSVTAGTTVVAGTGLTVSTGTATVPGGSAAAPSLNFANGTTTGISAPSANNLALSTAGVSRLAIDSSGNVTYSSNYKMSAYVGTARTITSATETVRFDTEIFDPNNNFNTTTWTYTAPVTGYYLVLTQVYFFANSTSGTPRSIQLVKNGSAVTGYSSSTTSVTNGQYGTLNLGSIIQLTAGNTLSVSFTGITGSGGDQIQPNASSLNIHFMSL